MSSKENADVENLNWTSASDDNAFDGTAGLAGDESLILIPTPSLDPQDPLNLSPRRKVFITAILTLYAVCGLCMISGLAALIVFIIPDYKKAGISENQISGLQTYPSLFLGLGNIISMPLAIAVGRRPVLLLSTLLLFVGSVLCATNQNFEWHLAARCVVAFAGAQCEALVLLILYDLYFLHQRAQIFQYFSSAEVIFNSSLVIASSYMDNALGWRSWYWMFSILSGICFILTFIGVPETCYERPIEAYMGKFDDGLAPTISPNSDSDPSWHGLNSYTSLAPIAVGDERKVNIVDYPPRTWASDMRIFVVRPNWTKVNTTLKQICQVYFFPHVLWVSMMNGLFQGCDVSIQITYGEFLVSPPYKWAPTSISLIQLGQILIALIGIPLLGQAGDKIIEIMARRNKGVHEPEYRLVTLIFPLLFCLMLTALYGDCIQNPGKYHWMLVVVTVNSYLLVLLASSTAGATYLLDAHPKRAGAILVVVPVTRGLVSFGISKHTVDYISNIGALNTFGIYAGLSGLFGLLGVVIFYKGKTLRHYFARWAI